MNEQSAFDSLVARVVTRVGREAARRVLTTALSSFTSVERAALAARWATWARPKQLAPSGPWRRWGYLTGRGFGKTLAISKFINEAVERGDASLICLIAQDEQSAIDIQVLGPSGLIATAPPWFKPVWEATSLQLVWPNGARAYVRTPEVPGKIRGLEYHLTWASELQSWPVATRDEAWSNVLLSTRLGSARVIWDSTPKRRHPILRELLAEAKDEPTKFVVVRGSTHENARNLGDGYVDDLEKKYGGTTKGREELLGEMLEESENATAQQVWIDKMRRVRPDKFVRRVLGADPAVSSNQKSDLTGIVLGGLGVDGQAHVLANFSGKYKPHAWAKVLLDAYAEEECDVILVETNRGGELVVSNLRAAAMERKLRIVELGLDECPRRTEGVINVKPLYSQGAKEDRAQPVATAYERGRVSHVIGADLASLEDTLTTWEPGAKTSGGNKSPDDLDALTFVVVELLGLTGEKKDKRAGVKGIQAAQQVLTHPAAASAAMQSIGRLLGGTYGGKI